MTCNSCSCRMGPVHEISFWDFSLAVLPLPQLFNNKCLITVTKLAHKIITFYRCLILSVFVMGFTMVTKSLRLSVYGVTTFFSYGCNNTEARDTFWSLVRTPPNLEVYLSVMFQESCMLDRNLRPQIAVFIVRNGSELALSRRIELPSGTIDCDALRSFVRWT
jgi:hypothetical protein